MKSMKICFILLILLSFLSCTHKGVNINVGLDSKIVKSHLKKEDSYYTNSGVGIEMWRFSKNRKWRYGSEYTITHQHFKSEDSSRDYDGIYFDGEVFVTRHFYLNQKLSWYAGGGAGLGFGLPADGHPLIGPGHTKGILDIRSGFMIEDILNGILSFEYRMKHFSDPGFHDSGANLDTVVVRYVRSFNPGKNKVWKKIKSWFKTDD